MNIREFIGNNWYYIYIYTCTYIFLNSNHSYSASIYERRLPMSAAAATESTSGDAEMRTFRRSPREKGRRDRDFGT